MGDTVERVRKMHYTLRDGRIYKSVVDINKTATLRRARQKSKHNHFYKTAFESEYIPFMSGNDAMLDFSPKGSGNKPKYRFFANSSVSDRSSLFFRLNRDYVLTPEKEAQTFQTFHTNRKREIKIGTPREYDTEYKLLEKIATHLKPEAQGKIVLYTYYEPCLSCDYVIIQFINRFKKIKMDVYFEKEYKDKGLI